MRPEDRCPAAIAVTLAVVLGLGVVYLSMLDPDDRAPRAPRPPPIVDERDPIGAVAPSSPIRPASIPGDAPDRALGQAVAAIVSPTAPTPSRPAWPVPPPAPSTPPFAGAQTATIAGVLRDWAGEPVADATITGCGSEAITDGTGHYRMDVAHIDCEIWPFAVFGGVGVKGLSVIAHPAPGAVLDEDLVLRPDGFLVSDRGRTCMATSMGGYATATIGPGDGSGESIALLATPPDESDGDAVFAAVSAACREALTGE